MSDVSRSLLDLRLVSAKDAKSNVGIQIHVSVQTTVVVDNVAEPTTENETVVTILGGPSLADLAQYDDPTSYQVTLCLLHSRVFGFILLFYRECVGVFMPCTALRSRPLP